MGLQTVWRSLPLNCSLRRDSGDGSAAPCHTGGVTRSVLGSFFFLLIRKKNCSGWQGLPGLTGSALPGSMPGPTLLGLPGLWVAVGRRRLGTVESGPLTRTERAA